MNILAILALGATLFVTPQKGPSPLTVDISVDVVGPVTGGVCLQVDDKFITCQELKLDKDVAYKVNWEGLTGSKPGTYEFKAVILDEQENTTFTSKPVTVVVTEGEKN